MREPLSHPGVIPPAVKCPAAFSVSIPGIAHFNNVIEEYRPGISLPRPTAFFAPTPGTARFNNSTEKYRPDISHPQAVPRPGSFFAPAPAPGTALFNNITEKYRSPLYRRLMGGESHA